MCFHGKSNILVKNKQTGTFEIIKAKHVYSNIHQVFDTQSNTFVDIRFNVIAGKVTNFFLLKKGCLGQDTPNIDFAVTAGHELLINGKKIKARDVPQAIKATTDPENVYSICTDYKYPILINNIKTYTWEYYELLDYAKCRGIKWKDNS